VVVEILLQLLHLKAMMEEMLIVGKMVEAVEVVLLVRVLMLQM
jgi:hypothetical protein